jgi:hypothetical protein
MDGPSRPHHAISDAVQSDAPDADIVRHVAAAIYLLLTFAMLARATHDERRL